VGITPLLMHISGAKVDNNYDFSKFSGEKIKNARHSLLWGVLDNG
jgi:hypothetical protein